jgi:hypothetical protein
VTTGEDDGDRVVVAGVAVEDYLRSGHPRNLGTRAPVTKHG